jgi:hypothetical protein
MNTDNLIAAIAADGAAGPPSIARRMAVALGIGGAISGVLFAYSLGVRPDIASALQTWRSPSGRPHALPDRTPMS